MVKYSSIIIGMIIFSVFLTLIFAMGGSVSSQYQSDSATNFTELSGNYEVYSNDETVNNGTLRKIQSKLDDSSNPVSVGADILIAAVDGVKLMFNSIATLNNVGNEVVNDSGGKIDPLFTKALGAILTVIFVVIVISMLMRFKPET